MIIGSHCGLKQPEMFLGSVKEALSYGATALMVYTGPPQSTLRASMSTMHVEEALALLAKNNIGKEAIIVHAPYIINPATSDLEKREFCISFIAEEVRRTGALGSKVLVLHPGNSLDLPREEAIKNVASVLNQIIFNTRTSDVVIALETMAGKGTEVGKTFEEVKAIIDLVEDKKRVGVCLDTCHIHDAGYDIINDYEGVKAEFDLIIGLDQIKAIHINDSKNPCGAHKDRHANIGTGFIGLEPLKRVCEDPVFVNIPKILETPYIDGEAPYKEEIIALRGN